MFRSDRRIDTARPRPLTRRTRVTHVAARQSRRGPKSRRRSRESAAPTSCRSHWHSVIALTPILLGVPRDAQAAALLGSQCRRVPLNNSARRMGRSPGARLRMASNFATGVLDSKVSAPRPSGAYVRSPSRPRRLKLVLTRLPSRRSMTSRTRRHHVNRQSTPTIGRLDSRTLQNLSGIAPEFALVTQSANTHVATGDLRSERYSA